MGFLKSRTFILSAVITILCLFIVGLYTITKNNEFNQAQFMVKHTNEVISDALLISQKMSSIISQQRGFLLTRNPVLMTNYSASKDDLFLLIEKLSDKIKDNESQIIRVEDLSKHYKRLVDNLEIRLTTPGNRLDDLETIQESKNNIAETINNILNEEYDLLSVRIDLIKTIQIRLLTGIIIGLIFTGLALIILNFYLYKSRHLNEIGKDRLHYALNATGEGIYDWDIKSGKVFYSKQFTDMVGYTSDEFGDNLESSKKIVYADDVVFVNETIDKFFNNKISEYSIEFRLVHKQGHLVWVNSRAELLRDKNNKPIRMIGTHRNITDQKTVEEALKDEVIEAEHDAETKSSFLAHMSHEIRTPLTAITGIAEILEKNSGDFSKRQKELIATLLTSTKSLKELVTDILDFSKIGKGEIDFDDQYFPITDLTNEVISIMSGAANEKNIEFKMIDDEVQNIQYFGDKARIRQILINLIGNAIKFTDNGGVVNLLIKKETIQDLEVLNFYVQDTGIGIEQDAIEAVFQEFQQGDSSVSRKYGGTGLGLPISKNLAVLMGGNISVESRKGLGSTFTLSLPIKDRVQAYNQNADPALKQKITDRLSATIRDEQIALIVEDYQGNVVILSYLMEEIGLPYDVAKNGEEAVKIWSEKHYDIVLMDVQMPIMDGLTATKRIRDIEKHNGFNATPIIGMTAHALIEDKSKCIDAGMTDYLSKPIDSTKFKEKILSHIQKDNVIRRQKTATS